MQGRPKNYAIKCELLAITEKLKQEYLKEKNPLKTRILAHRIERIQTLEQGL